MEDNIHTDNATTIHANSLTHSPTKRMCLSQTKNSFKITKYSVELQRNETKLKRKSLKSTFKMIWLNLIHSKAAEMFSRPQRTQEGHPGNDKGVCQKLKQLCFKNVQLE